MIVLLNQPCALIVSISDITNIYLNKIALFYCILYIVFYIVFYIVLFRNSKRIILIILLLLLQLNNLREHKIWYILCGKIFTTRYRQLYLKYWRLRIILTYYKSLPNTDLVLSQQKCLYQTCSSDKAKLDKVWEMLMSFEYFSHI